MIPRWALGYHQCRFSYQPDSRVIEIADGKEFHGDAWPGAAAFPDFTCPKAQQWWAGLYKDFIATGIDGVWNDVNEPQINDTPNKTMPEDNIHRGGNGLPGLHSNAAISSCLISILSCAKLQPTECRSCALHSLQILKTCH